VNTCFRQNDALNIFRIVCSKRIGDPHAHIMTDNVIASVP